VLRKKVSVVLDFMIPLNERHLRRLLTEWVARYNEARPDLVLGPHFRSSFLRGTGTSESKRRRNAFDAIAGPFRA
jgi:hypothetical protein